MIAKQIASKKHYACKRALSIRYLSKYDLSHSKRPFDIDWPYDTGWPYDMGHMIWAIIWPPYDIGYIMIWVTSYESYDMDHNSFK